MGANHGEEREYYSAEIGKEVELDLENHSTEENNKGKRVTRVPKKITKRETMDTTRSPRISRANTTTKLQFSKSYTNNNLSAPKKLAKQLLSVSNNNSTITRSSNNGKRITEIETEAVLEKTVQFATTTEDAKEIDVLDEAPNCDQSNSTDTETPDREEDNVIPHEEKIIEIIYQKVEELEVKVEKLEDELREVAAIESSIYSVVSEHAISGYEMHTPARRLSKVFIHACESYSQDKKDSMVRSIVSGLILVAKSCGNDVPRLTFWLSNTVVLREIITQNLGKLSRNRAVKDTSTFMIGLKKIESWIFNRIVESVWWQALTPYMQSPVGNPHLPLSSMILPGQYSGDRKQFNFSVNLWTIAFHDAFNRLCPLRAGGTMCGCLPALAKLVMEHCIARLDVAMFNAILRESASEEPTDPISDPISDPKVLPISPRDLSFGTGAQLRNAIGNWSISLTETVDMNAEESRTGEIRWFRLLQELSELLMLPKDMLLETPIRQEVCPSFGLPLITRILCDFTPDEYSPDPVPSFVLDELNSESLLDDTSDKEQVASIPCAASTIAYRPFELADVAVEVAIARDATAKLDKKVNTQMNEDDLRDLDLKGVNEMSHTNERYKLLQEIWSN